MSGEPAAPEHPCQGCGGGVETSAHEGVDLVEDLLLAQRRVVHEHLQHVVGVVRGILSDGSHSLADQVVEVAAVRSNPAPLAEWERVGELFPCRPLEIVLRALHELAELVGSVGHGGTEERPDDDLENGGPADPVQVDLMRPGGRE